MRILLQEDDRGCCPTLLRGSEVGGSVEPGLDKGMGKRQNTAVVLPAACSLIFHSAAGDNPDKTNSKPLYRSMKILLDTDIGSDIDDALALSYLLARPDVDLLGITTVTGEPEKRAAMAHAICRHFGKPHIPVHVGFDNPLANPVGQPKAPQAARLDRWAHDSFDPKPTAVAFLRETIRANPGEVTLFAIGPLTNIAVLFLTDPEIPALLKDFVLMGGHFLPEPKDEWNIRCDAAAAAIVFDAAGNRCRPPRIAMVGTDVTRRCTMTKEACRERFARYPALAPAADFASVWFELEKTTFITFHDPLAAVTLFEPDVCTWQDGLVQVRLDWPPPAWGETLFTPAGRSGGNDAMPPHRIAASVDPERFFDAYFRVF